jgi:hypothetical protein
MKVKQQSNSEGKRAKATRKVKERSNARVCHPDEASNASGRKDLGQLRASEAGSGFGLAKGSQLLFPFPRGKGLGVRFLK